jgi:hypothetical protein
MLLATSDCTMTTIRDGFASASRKRRMMGFAA